MQQYCNIYYCLKRKEEKPEPYVRKLLDYGFLDSFLIPYREEEIVREKHGKPLSIHKGNYFNISHGQRIVALACAKVPVGVDVESPRRVSENAMRRGCTDSEWEWLGESENRERDFLRLWTLKESYVKMLGTGLRTAPHEVGFRLPAMEAGSMCKADMIPGEISSNGEGFFLQYVLEEGILALCLENTERNWKKEEVSFYKLSF